MLFKYMFLCMEKSRFGLLDNQGLRSFDSLVVHNFLSSETWLGLMLGMKVTENQCSFKETRLQYPTATQKQVSVFLISFIEGANHSTFVLHLLQPDDSFSLKIQSLCPTITGDICCTTSQFGLLRAQVQQVPILFSRFPSTICSY